MKNKLVIPIANILSQDKLRKAMEEIFIHSDEVFDKLADVRKTKEIEKEGFLFKVKKVDLKSGATQIEINFSKEIEGWFGYPDNKVIVKLEDSFIIENNGRRQRRLFPFENCNPRIHLKNLSAEIQINNAKFKSFLNFAIPVTIGDKDVVVDFDNHSFHGYSRGKGDEKKY